MRGFCAVATSAALVLASTDAFAKACLAIAPRPMRLSCEANSADGRSVTCKAKYFINTSCIETSFDGSQVIFYLADPQTGRQYPEVWSQPAESADATVSATLQVPQVPTLIIAKVAKYVDDKRRPGYLKLHVFDETKITYRGSKESDDAAGWGGQWRLVIPSVNVNAPINLQPEGNGTYAVSVASGPSGQRIGVGRASRVGGDSLVLVLHDKQGTEIRVDVTVRNGEGRGNCVKRQRNGRVEDVSCMLVR